MLLRILLALIVAAGIGQNAAAGNPVASLNTASMGSVPYTFAEIHALTTDAQPATLAAMSRPVVRAQQAVVHAVDPIQRPAVRLPEGVLVQVDAVPEPTGWMTFLSGLLAVVLIARRRANLAPD